MSGYYSAFLGNYFNYFSSGKKVEVVDFQDTIESVSSKLSTKSEEVVISMLVVALCRDNSVMLEKLTNPEYTGLLTKVEMDVLGDMVDDYLNVPLDSSCLTEQNRKSLTEMMRKESNLVRAQKIVEKMKKSTKKVSLGTNMSSLMLLFFMIGVASAGTCCGPDCTGPFVGYSNMVTYNGEMQDTWIERFTEGFGNTSHLFVCDSSTVPRKTCYSDLTQNTGDDFYCRTVACNGTLCNCVTKFGGIKYYNYDGSIEYQMTKVECHSLPVEEESHSRRNARNVDGGCPAVTRTFTDTNVIFTVDDNQDVTASFSKDGKVVDLIPLKGLNTFLYPPEMTQVSGTMSFIISKGGKVCYKDDYLVKVSANCQVYDCIYCTEVFSSMNCLPRTYKFAAAMMIALTIAAFLILTPCLWWMISLFWCMMKWPVMKSRKIVKNKVDKLKEQDVESPTMSRRAARKNRRLGLSEMTLLIMSFGYCFGATPVEQMREMVYAASSWSCYSGLDIGSASSCTSSSSDYQKCALSFSRTFEFLGPSKTCLTFSDETNSVTQVNISYVMDEVFMSNDHLYETGDFSVVSKSFHGCYGDGWCGDSCNTCCNSRTANGFPSDVASYPGITQCRRSCSGFSCGSGVGCILPVSSCVMQGYGIKPKTKVCEVYSPITVSRVSNFLLEWIAADGSRNKTIISKFSYSPFGKNDFGVTVAGEFTDSTTNLADNKYIACNDDTFWFGPAADSGSQKGGAVGDVQANFGEYKSGIFNYAKDIVTMTQSNTYTTFSSQPSGVSFLKQGKYVVLPGVIGDYTIMTSGGGNYGDGQLYGYDKKGGKTLITFDSKANFIAYKQISVACAVFGTPTTTGCYNCQSGAVTLVDISSSCNDGSFMIDTSDDAITVSSGSISVLKLKPTSFAIHFRTYKSLNNFDMIFTSADKTQYKLNIHFAASIENNTDITNDTDTTDTGSKPISTYSFPDSWKNFIKGLTTGNFFSYLFTIIASIVIIIVGYFVIKFLWNMLSAINEKTKTDTKTKEK